MLGLVPLFLIVLIYFSLRWSLKSMKRLYAQDLSEGLREDNHSEGV